MTGLDDVDVVCVMQSRNGDAFSYVLMNSVTGFFAPLRMTKCRDDVDAVNVMQSRNGDASS